MDCSENQTLRFVCRSGRRCHVRITLVLSCTVLPVTPSGLLFTTAHGFERAVLIGALSPYYYIIIHSGFCQAPLRKNEKYLLSLYE